MAGTAESGVRRLVGRDADCRRLDALLDALRGGRGGALIVTGEPGIGKTALLDHAGHAASGVTVLRTDGLESESALPYVGLGDALRPLLAGADELPPPQAGALRAALELEHADRPVALFAVCLAALNLLAAAAERRPVLLLVDDAQWLDPASASVLLFVARRLADDPVAVIFAIRDGAAGTIDGRGIARARLEGLDPEDSARLIEDLHGTATAPEVAGRLWRATRGNPLALRELSLRLDPDQLAGLRPLPEPLPLGADIVRAFTAALAPLPAPTRTALLVVALAAVPEVPVLIAALAALGLEPSVLDPADDAGLITTDGNRVRFTHPLVRSAVADASGGWSRRRVYDALIASADGDAKLGYRAAAATAPDDDLAGDLEAAAARMRDRSGSAAAARLLHRAAGLSTDPEHRSRRLLGAGIDAADAGRLDDATAWLDQARSLTTDPRAMADVDLARGRTSTLRGTPAIAEQVLVAAADAVAHADPGRAVHLLCEAALPMFTEGRIAVAEAACRRAVDLATAIGDPATADRANLSLAESLVLGGRIPDARRVLARLGRPADQLDPAESGPELGLLGICHGMMEEFDHCRRLVDRVIGAARRAGQVGALASTLNYRSELGRWTGDWVRGYADAEEALRLSREIRQPLTIGLSLVILARFDAAQGRPGLVRQRLDQGARMSGPLGMPGLLVWSGSALGLLHLAMGEPERAVDRIEEVRAFARHNGVGNPNMAFWEPDLVEAYARCGRVAEAADRLDEFDAHARETGLPTPLAAVERCRGLLAADPDAASAHFAAATALHGDRSQPFERARTVLCHAETLRRHRRPADARPLLRDALAVFRGLGAAPFARRAATELAAAGERPAATAVPENPARRLTAQELQVATAVARGLSNPEIAVALFISRKTVEAHLSRIYRKLTLTSRTQLVRFLTEAGVDLD